MDAEAASTVVGEIGRHWSRVSPDAIALEDGSAALSYRRLDERVDHLAGRLIRKGIRRGDVVSALLPNGCDCIVVVLAAARAGAVFCPLNPRFTARELTRLVRVAKPRAVLVGANRHPALADPVLLVLCPDEIIVEVGTEEEGLSTAAARPAVEPADFFSLMFTSGTTGEPKGALATHAARATWISSGIVEFGLARDDIYLSAMPLVHSAGLTLALMHLAAGARVHLMPRFDASEFLRLASEEKITSALAVPTMLAMLLTELDDGRAEYELSSLRRLITCGAPLSQATKSATLRRLSAQLYDFYGSTESNSMTVLHPRDQLRKARSVGKPFPGVEIRIAGPSGEALPSLQVGEIWSFNPSTMSRYLDAPDATAAAFSGRWYRTGDLGYLDDEGYLYLNGRAQEMIISGGMNIYPPEIESILMEHPHVRDCAVVGMADETWGQVVTAFIALHGEARLTLGEVQSHCKQRLADFKKPRQIEIVGEIPRNAGGKVVKSALTNALNHRA
jgi:acyl-CoA synthetase (AMP-forming)/AMP-acid ligase II